MLKFFGLAFLRPVGRFLSQWISVSTAPITFARERIRLGDSLNFFNAANFFVYAIFGAVLAEATTLHLLVATKVPIYKELGHQCQCASSPVRLGRPTRRQPAI